MASALFPYFHIHLSTSLSAFLAQDAGQAGCDFPVAEGTGLGMALLRVSSHFRLIPSGPAELGEQVL